MAELTAAIQSEATASTQPRLSVGSSWWPKYIFAHTEFSSPPITIQLSQNGILSMMHWNEWESCSDSAGMSILFAMSSTHLSCFGGCVMQWRGSCSLLILLTLFSCLIQADCRCDHYWTRMCHPFPCDPYSESEQGKVMARLIVHATTVNRDNVISISKDHAIRTLDSNVHMERMMIQS
jgi:hypothetical protein